MGLYVTSHMVGMCIQSEHMRWMNGDSSGFLEFYEKESKQLYIHVSEKVLESEEHILWKSYLLRRNSFIVHSVVLLDTILIQFWYLQC